MATIFKNNKIINMSRKRNKNINKVFSKIKKTKIINKLMIKRNSANRKNMRSITKFKTIINSKKISTTKSMKESIKKKNIINKIRKIK